MIVVGLCVCAVAAADEVDVDVDVCVYAGVRRVSEIGSSLPGETLGGTNEEDEDEFELDSNVGDNDDDFITGLRVAGESTMMPAG